MVMAKDIMETVSKRIKEGWIKTWTATEVIAVTEEAAESSLKKHVELIGKEPDLMIYNVDYKKTEKTPHPFEKGKEAYTKVVEIELIARRFENLVYFVLNYAPSSIEIMEPNKIEIPMGEAQNVLNSMAELVHSLVARTRGAVTIPT